VTFEVLHFSKYLLKAAIDEPSKFFLDGIDYGDLPAYRWDSFDTSVFFLFWPSGFNNGSIISIRPKRPHLMGVDFVVDIPECHEARELALLSVGLHSAPDWAIDDIQVSNRRVRFSGWVIGKINLSASIFVNECPCTVSFIERSDLSPVFGHLSPYRTWNGYAAEGEIDEGIEEIAFTTSDLNTMKYYYSVIADQRYPSPNEEQIKRVNGPLNRAVFNRIGYSHYKRISQLVTGQRPGLSKYRILDWGCGCGGLARFFLQDDRFVYRGCDIDPENLNWCKAHLDSDKFIPVPLSPPQENPFDISFDVIFGISVISHLSPDNIRAWLSWLADILSEDGIVILSTLSTQALSKLQPSDAYKIMSAGADFYLDRTAIGSIIKDQNYYGTAFQTPAGLAKLSPAGLRLTHHFPAGLSQQDLFVFEKRLN
jgi:2-polyprenyl-3-methyl-5-hydroxy-6-metoxy-1,4-benzoquinol methylase